MSRIMDWPKYNFIDDFGDMETVMTKKEPKALESQVGGSHYTELGIQPLENTFANFGYTGVQASIYTKVNKYLTREKGTHRQDLSKAIHVLQMQVEYYDRHNTPKAVEQDDIALAPRHTNEPIDGNK
tara:strand:+ start:131 stop:511 length:381 start_codon:yes stop_codon:yes gene_type:complete